ncbi:MAG TPA: DUF898 family protein [Spirochaetia bacterium]
MKTSFAFSLKGRDWWGPFIGFWVIFLALYIPEAAVSKWVPADNLALTFPVLILFMFLMIVVQSIFTIVFARILLPKLSVDGKSFGFEGSIGKFLGINLLGLFLSLITIFIYYPWYLRKVTDYLLSQTSFDGEPATFFGKGGKLFVYFLLSFLIPIIVVSVIIGIVVGVSGTVGSAGSAATSLTTAILVLVVFLVMTPYCYLMMKWYVNVGWKDLRTTWDAKFWPSCGFLLGQLCLTIITLGFYGPAAVIRGYRYFAPKIGLARGDVEAGRLGFDGEVGKGYGLLLGQGLLALITLGIYVPWAYARVGAWMASHTFLERKD